jgi:CDP-glycerol glycerophosphotransferase (TagB/SpsB family)
MLGFLFPRIRAAAVVMTMPDLNNFLFKRSPFCKTYLYIFHAAVSTHQQYRKEAFFHYDAICCTGEYQLRELRTAEELYGNRAKELIPFGYPLFQELREKEQSTEQHTILIAPSWFNGCIFDTCIEAMLGELSKTSSRILVRPHPEYVKRDRKGYKRLEAIISSHRNMSLDENTDVLDSLVMADVLITDRSGIALEFAFGKRKPVLFVDTVLKKSNPSAGDLKIEPLENSIRNEIGISISPGNMEAIPQALEQLNSLAATFADKMSALEQETFFDINEGMENVIQYLRTKIRP